MGNLTILAHFSKSHISNFTLQTVGKCMWQLLGLLHHNPCGHLWTVTALLLTKQHPSKNFQSWKLWEPSLGQTKAGNTAEIGRFLCAVLGFHGVSPGGNPFPRTYSIPQYGLPKNTIPSHAVNWEDHMQGKRLVATAGVDGKVHHFE